MNPNKSSLLCLPAELLLQIARYACPPELRYPFILARIQSNLFNFRLTCKALDAASFDFFIKAYPERVRIQIDHRQNLKNFKTQLSLIPLASKIKAVTLTVSSPEAQAHPFTAFSTQTESTPSSEPSQPHQKVTIHPLEPAENFTKSDELSPILLSLQTLPNPPRLNLDISPRAPMPKRHLAAIMNAIPAQMVHRLHLPLPNYPERALLDLLSRSHDTLESFFLGVTQKGRQSEHYRAVERQLEQCWRLMRSRDWIYRRAVLF